MSLEKDQEVVEEDDWSSFLCPQHGETTAFVHHDHKVLSLSETSKLHIKCVAALSPLDMIAMYHGAQDATGNCIWTGALFFLEAFARPLPPPESGAAQSRTTIRPLLSDLRDQVIRNKTILEMGTGTGISGLSILTASDEQHSPLHVTFTDSDAAALGLCGKNCEMNVKDKELYTIQQLEWGRELPEGICAGSYDTVIATDVLYDIASLPPLMQTAPELLKPEGYFILSHVPRASVESNDGESGSAVASAESLTSLIVAEASRYHLYLGSLEFNIVEPKELSLLWGGKALNEAAFIDMENVGAAILVFRKI